MAEGAMDTTDDGYTLGEVAQLIDNIKVLEVEVSRAARRPPPGPPGSCDARPVLIARAAAASRAAGHLIHISFSLCSVGMVVLQLRLQSMNALVAIATALGPERTRNELLPFLHGKCAVRRFPAGG